MARHGEQRGVQYNPPNVGEKWECMVAASMNRVVGVKRGRKGIGQGTHIDGL